MWFENLKCMICLAPDMVELFKIRLPRFVRPFWIWDPDISGCIGEQRWIQNLKEHIYFGFGAFWVRVVDSVKCCVWMNNVPHSL